MTGSAIVTWDGGRLAVNLTFAPLLEVAGLTTVAAFMEFDGGEVAKSAVVDRRTDRIQLTGQGDEFVGFLKRHRRPRWSEYLKACLRLTRPTLGARGEWEAIWRFHEAGLPTMTPVAFGEDHAGSFVLTESLEPAQKLSALAIEPTLEAASRHRLVREVADLARRLRRLGSRWIIKDLAQLHYSSGNLTATDRLRFMTKYLGRPPGDADQRFLERVARKSEAIALHSRKHRL